MEKINLQLEANTKEAEKRVKKLTTEVKDLGKEAERTGEKLDAGLQLGNSAVRALDRLTGGLTSKLIAVGKAATLSGKAMKTALISTGIGALVVALGLVVEYWDDIKTLIDGVSDEQKELLETTQKTLDVQEQQLKSTGQMENTLKLQGKSEKEIRDLKRQQTDEIITSTELLLEQQKSQKKAQVEAAERNKSITMGIITFLTAPIVMILSVVDALSAAMASLGIVEEATNLAEGYVTGVAEMLFDPEEVAAKGDETINETENKLRQLKNTRDGYALKDKEDKKRNAEDITKDEINAEKEKAAALESIRKALIDTEDEERAEKLRKIGEDYDEQIRLAEQYYGEESEKVLELRAARKLAIDTQQAEWDEQDKEKEEAEKERLKKINSDKWDELQAQYDEERDLEKQKIRDKAMVVDAISQFADAESGIGQALLIVKQGLMLQETIMDLKRITFKGKQALGEAAVANAENVAQSSKIGYPWNILTIAAAIGQGIGIINSVKKAVASTKANVSTNTPTPNVSSPSTNSLPPAFNIVGASGTNQLADAIGGQTQQPTKAYVVATDVSTAQELDRNIIEGASIG